MLTRPVGMLGGLQGMLPAATVLCSQKSIQTNSAGAATTLTAGNVTSGYLNRTGPGAGFVDTWPTADQILAAMDDPSVGDQFEFTYRNSVAFAMTFAAGTGIVSGIGTLSVAASSTKLYSMTVLSNKPTVTKSGSTTNATATLTNIATADLKDIQPGMGVSGTNIGASAVVLGIAYNDTTGFGTVTVSVVSTGTGDNIGITFFPRIQLDALGVMTN